MGKRAAGTTQTRTSIPPASEAVPRTRTRTSMPPALGRRVVETTVVTAAMKVFARRGYASARVEDILEEAGIARRTFYRYFTNKDDVLVSLYDVATSDLLRRLNEAPAHADPISGLMESLDRYLDFHVENAVVCRLVMPLLAGDDSPVAPARRRVRAQLLRLMVQYAEARDVMPLDGFTYVAMVAALQGVAMELLESSATPEEIVRAKRAVRELAEHGLVRGDGRATR